MASREERERSADLKALFWRRVMYVGVLVVAVGIAIWFVSWLSSGVGLNKIGDHYKEAEKE
jgi:protein-S-isoprenylcysteine O-methyltransferase Ste14